MPISTVLCAAKGEIIHYSVNPAPWAVEIPPLPEELLAPAVVETKPVQAPPQKSPPSIGVPLIITSKKIETPPAPKPPEPLSKPSEPNAVPPTQAPPAPQSSAPPADSREAAPV